MMEKNLLIKVNSSKLYYLVKESSKASKSQLGFYFNNMSFMFNLSLILCLVNMCSSIWGDSKYDCIKEMNMSGFYKAPSFKMFNSGFATKSNNSDFNCGSLTFESCSLVSVYNPLVFVYGGFESLEEEKILGDYIMTILNQLEDFLKFVKLDKEIIQTLSLSCSMFNSIGVSNYKILEMLMLLKMVLFKMDFTKSHTFSYILDIMFHLENSSFISFNLFSQEEDLLYTMNYPTEFSSGCGDSLFEVLSSNMSFYDYYNYENFPMNMDNYLLITSANNKYSTHYTYVYSSNSFSDFCKSLIKNFKDTFMGDNPLNFLSLNSTVQNSIVFLEPIPMNLVYNFYYATEINGMSLTPNQFLDMSIMDGCSLYLNILLVKALLDSYSSSYSSNVLWFLHSTSNMGMKNINSNLVGNMVLGGNKWVLSECGLSNSGLNLKSSTDMDNPSIMFLTVSSKDSFGGKEDASNLGELGLSVNYNLIKSNEEDSYPFMNFYDETFFSSVEFNKVEFPFYVRYCFKAYCASQTLAFSYALSSEVQESEGYSSLENSLGSLKNLYKLYSDYLESLLVCSEGESVKLEGMKDKDSMAFYLVQAELNSLDVKMNTVEDNLKVIESYISKDSEEQFSLGIFVCGGKHLEKSCLCKKLGGNMKFCDSCLCTNKKYMLKSNILGEIMGMEEEKGYVENLCLPSPVYISGTEMKSYTDFMDPFNTSLGHKYKTLFDSFASKGAYSDSLICESSSSQSMEESSKEIEKLLLGNSSFVIQYLGLSLKEGLLESILDLLEEQEKGGKKEGEMEPFSLFEISEAIRMSEKTSTPVLKILEKLDKESEKKQYMNLEEKLKDMIKNKKHYPNYVNFLNQKSVFEKMEMAQEMSKIKDENFEMICGSNPLSLMGFLESKLSVSLFNFDIPRMSGLEEAVLDSIEASEAKMSGIPAMILTDEAMKTAIFDASAGEVLDKLSLTSDYSEAASWYAHKHYNDISMGEEILVAKNINTSYFMESGVKKSLVHKLTSKDMEIGVTNEFLKFNNKIMMISTPNSDNIYTMDLSDYSLLENGDLENFTNKYGKGSLYKNWSLDAVMMLNKLVNFISNYLEDFSRKLGSNEEILSQHLGGTYMTYVSYLSMIKSLNLGLEQMESEGMSFMNSEYEDYFGEEKMYQIDLSELFNENFGSNMWNPKGYKSLMEDSLVKFLVCYYGVKKDVFGSIKAVEDMELKNTTEEVSIILKNETTLQNYLAAIIFKESYFQDTMCSLMQSEGEDEKLCSNDFLKVLWQLFNQEVIFYKDFVMPSHKDFLDQISSRKSFYKIEENNNHILFKFWDKSKGFLVHKDFVQDFKELGIVLETKFKMLNSSLKNIGGELTKSGLSH